MRYLIWTAFGVMLALSARAAEVSTADLEQAIFNQVNEVRKEKGLPPLEYNEDLAQMAREHSEEMATDRKLSHDGFSERFDAARAKIPGLSALGENVAMNFPQEDIVSDTLRKWMNSPVHRTNILRPNKITGVGVARAGDGSYYFTQIFGH